jgi:DNA-directed RNA polymerase subunit E'/Rpb7
MSDALFHELILNHKIFLLPKEVNLHIDTTIYNKLVSDVGNKCCKDGYVKKDSIKIIDRTIGKVDAIHFNGRIQIDIRYSALVCNPSEGTIITGGVINGINKMGAQVILEPLSIVLPKQHHENPEVFKNLKKGEKVNINIIGTKFELHNTEICAIGLIV